MRHCFCGWVVKLIPDYFSKMINLLNSPSAAKFSLSIGSPSRHINYRCCLYVPSPAVARSCLGHFTGTSGVVPGLVTFLDFFIASFLLPLLPSKTLALKCCQYPQVASVQDLPSSFTQKSACVGLLARPQSHLPGLVRQFVLNSSC